MVVFDEELDELEVEDPTNWNGDDAAGSQGKRVMLRLLGEALEGATEEAQALFWHRLVQGDDWAEAGAAFNLVDTSPTTPEERTTASAAREAMRRLRDYADGGSTAE